MSRAGNNVGAPTIEDRGGHYLRPWTADDALRLRGGATHRFSDGVARALPPHVLTPGGAYYLGVVKPLSPGRLCRSCRAHKVRARRGDGQDFCFGCGEVQ